MNESKIVATERLRAEGRWDEASQYRDDVRRKLRAEGKPRAEAADMSWDAMVVEYPPLPVAEPSCPEPAPEPEPDEDIDALVARVEGNQPDLVRDTLWAYENLANRNARPEDAPGVGAWSLLKWGRDYRNRFFEQMLPKAMAARAKEEEKREEADLDPGIEEIRKLLDDVDRRMEESLAKDVPGRVQSQVGSMLLEWIRKFDVTVSDAAAESLRLHMVGVANDCIKAALRHPERYAELSQRK